jgi:heme-degrading monooxygenase HmoA
MRTLKHRALDFFRRGEQRAHVVTNRPFTVDRSRMRNSDGMEFAGRYANTSLGDHPMFIAMNRFRVAKGSEAAFEHVWLSRDSHLDKVPGFVEFHLLKGPEAEDHTLYASHTVWQSRAAFEAWTQSEPFRAAHRDAGDHKPLYLGHPQFEGFEVRQTVGMGRARVA